MDVGNYAIKLPRENDGRMCKQSAPSSVGYRKRDLFKGAHLMYSCWKPSVSGVHTRDNWSQLLPPTHPVQECGKWSKLTCINKEESLRAKTWSGFTNVKIIFVGVPSFAFMLTCGPQIVQTLLPSLQFRFPAREPGGHEFTAEARGRFFWSRRS